MRFEKHRIEDCAQATSHVLTASWTIKTEKRKKLLGNFFFSFLKALPGAMPHNTDMENTRAFVSGLPPSFSNDQLKKHFSSRFEVTDAHVLPKRRIGFVGFKNPDIAKQAVDYFNRTYIKMSKIAVEIARPVCVIIVPNCPRFDPFAIVQADRVKVVLELTRIMTIGRIQTCR